MYNNFRIVCISCPTLYRKLKDMSCPNGTKLLEFDTRFSCYGDDYVFYDYKDPLALPKDWKGTFDVVVVDPPFLSEECLSKAAETVKFLEPKFIVLCTGTGLARSLNQTCHLTMSLLQVLLWSHTHRGFSDFSLASLNQSILAHLAMSTSVSPTMTLMISFVSYYQMYVELRNKYEEAVVFVTYNVY